MSGAPRVTRVGELLRETARAHHHATGGPDPEWPRWYATFLAGRLDEHLGSSPTIEQVEEWLRIGERRLREEHPEGADWVPVYAGVLVQLGGESGT
jgi:hypothetical protein